MFNVPPMVVTHITCETPGWQFMEGSRFEPRIRGECVNCETPPALTWIFLGLISTVHGVQCVVLDTLKVYREDSSIDTTMKEILPWRDKFQVYLVGKVHLQFPTKDKLSSCSSSHRHGKDGSQQFKGQTRKIKYGISTVYQHSLTYSLFKATPGIFDFHKKVSSDKTADLRGMKNGEAVGPDEIPL